MKANEKQIVYNIEETDYCNQLSTLLPPLSLPSYLSTYSFPLINGVFDYTYTKEDGNNDFTLISDKMYGNFSTTVSANFPLFLNHSNTIKIPTKVEYNLKRNTPKALLKAIHPNMNVAVEFCLLYLKNLNSTHFELKKNSDSNGWKALQAKHLRDYFSNSSLTYKKIRTALEFSLKNGPILECDYTSAKNKKCYKYRLGEAYREKGIVSYELNTKEAIDVLKRHHERLFQKAIQNPICKNLLKFYSQLSFPDIEEINAEAINLINSGKKTKKGKRLTFLNKHSRSYFKKPKRRAFVEEHIKRYQNLTENGLMIPRPGSAASGGRVVDSLTLMPGWIRAMLKIDGILLDECDYICLHPNIALSLYGGSQEFVTHENVALHLSFTEEEVKRQHLSFFNEDVVKMYHYKVYEYYLKTEPQMLQKIINEKCNSEFGHHVTSRRMFKREVEIMTDVIIQLNHEGIYVGYIYDALLCHPKHTYRVKEIMNSTILKYGVKTKVKSSRDKILFPIFVKSEQKRAVA